MKLSPFGAVLFACAVLSVSCSQSPGELKITLDASALADASKSAITQYFFVVQNLDRPTDSPIFFPASCIGSATVGGTTTSCLKTAACGFSASDATFKPEISFTQIGDQENFSLTVCGVGSASNRDVKASGVSGTISNVAGGAAVSVTMSDTDLTACQSILTPPDCG